MSIDEAYLDVTKRIETFVEEFGSEENAIRGLIASIKNAIRDSEAITCSIGIAGSKTIAKIAADANKPDGFTIVYPKDVIEFLSPLSVSKISGVGKVTQRILETQFNVKTIQELRGVPVEDTLHLDLERVPSGS